MIIILAFLVIAIVTFIGHAIIPYILLVGIAVTVAGLLFVWENSIPLLILAIAPFHGIIAALFDNPMVNVWKELLVAIFLLKKVVLLVIKKETWPPIPINYPIWVFIGICLLHGVVAHNFHVAALSVKILVFFILFFFMFINIPHSEKYARSIIMIYLLTGIVTGLFGILQFTSGSEFFSQLTYLPKITNQVVTFAEADVLFWRAFSTFAGPGFFAHYLVMVLFLSIVVLLFPSLKQLRLLAIICIAICSPALVMTFVRSAWFAFALGCASLAVTKKVKVLFYFGILWCLMIFLAPLAANRIKSTFTAGDISYNIRKEQTTFVGLKNMVKHPFGVGLETLGGRFDLKTGAAAGFYIPGTDKRLVGWLPDNQYISIALQLGWVGLAAYIWILLTALMTAWKEMKNPKDDMASILNVTSFCVLVQIVLASFAGEFVEAFPLSLLAGCFLALPFVYQHQALETKDGT
jgi:O-antigen ligase